MFKRVMAWILLAGFVLLLLNIAVFGIYRELSAAIYLAVMLMYVFYIIANKK
ncbi:MAG TPA: hypothetical protein PLH43_02875 [Acetivibrio sp.]|uniref:hypothetical protein n=1 Tax=Acetivibrio sp. TaxID=1872092 RepID=UPI002B67EDDD|nr:hypothetical protein [Acetivibrio sp.]HOM01757.1 hypothetical protein [Acetivibrio sp.]